MNAQNDALLEVLRELASAGRKLVETSESCLALLRDQPADCLPRVREPAVEDQKSMLMTAGEVAVALRVGARTFRRMRAAGQAPKPVKVGGVVRWRRTTVESWLSRRRS